MSLKLKIFFVKPLIFVWIKMKFAAKPYNLSTTMKKHFTLFALLIGLVNFLNAETIQINKSLKDSIGVEKVGSSIFILHKVKAKETLYSLSRRYKVTVDAIVKHNAEAANGLKIGDVLKIPYKVETAQAPSSSKASHTVAPSQTLFSISRMYHVSVEDIKRWNNLSSNDLSVGQVLVVSAKAAKENDIKPEQEKNAADLSKNTHKGESGTIVHKVAPSQTLFSISQLYGVSVEDLKQWNKLKDNALEVGRELVINVKTQAQPYDSLKEPKEKKDEAALDNVARLDNMEEKATAPKGPETAEKKPESKKGNSSGFKKVVELGMAEIIENASDTKKYVALHRTAPIGTIMQVTNEMNNQNVFVRVIGKLPATGVNDKVLIKLSKPAFERLGAVNDRFPAEISYVP